MQICGRFLLQRWQVLRMAGGPASLTMWGEKPWPQCPPYHLMAHSGSPEQPCLPTSPSPADLLCLSGMVLESRVIFLGSYLPVSPLTPLCKTLILLPIGRTTKEPVFFKFSFFEIGFHYSILIGLELCIDQPGLKLIKLHLPVPPA